MSRLGVGAAVLIRDRRIGPHLFVVLTEPEPTSGRMVIAPVVTERAHTDKTVRLEVGDHPFIRHRSNVSYGDATFAFLRDLQAAVDSGDATVQDDLETSLVQRLQHGLLSSSRTIHAIADYARDALARS